MTKKIDKESVEKIADLAKIELTSEEIERFSGQLGSIIEYVEKLNEVDTDDIDFKSHVELENVMREDEPEESLSQEDAISQARNKNGYISIKKYFD